MKIIRLIAEGLDDKSIVKQVGCSPKYPVQLRSKLKHMPEEERQNLIKQAKEKAESQKEMTRPISQEQEERLKAMSGFRTPYTAQKNSKRIAISRY